MSEAYRMKSHARIPASRPLSFFAVAGLCLAAAAGCGRSAAESKPMAAHDAGAPISVKTVAVQTVKVPRVLTLSGSLTGSEEAQVAAGAAGKVLQTYVERGSVVKKGALLARLD